MRLRSLDLIRYGRFTDHRLDFGEKQKDAPDLHIIYGPNEAGKSTTFAAYLDLLFGIETRSNYNFLHPYPTMRIGGTLEFSTGVQQFIRVKRPNNSLLDANEQPIADNAIRAELGGIDRDGYRSMFSLDDETLEQGGESILASRGELGQLLFSAASGFADIAGRLADIRSDADSFYRFRARGGELSALKERLATLREEKDAIDTQAGEYTALVAARDRAAHLYDETMAERGRLRFRFDEIGRQVATLPRLTEWRALRDQADAFDEIPEPPAAWVADLPDLIRQEIAFSVRLRGAHDMIEQISGALSTIEQDDDALALAGEAEGLAVPRDRFTTAEKDLPERRLQLRSIDATVAAQLVRLNRADEPDPTHLILPAATIGTLRALIESRSGIESELAAAEREHQATAEAVQTAEIALGRLADGDAIPSEAVVASLKSAIGAARAVDFTGRRQTATRNVERETDALQARMASLAPWEGTPQALAILPVPEAETIAGWKSALVEIENQIAQRQDEIDRLTTDVQREEAELQSALTSGAVVDDRQADVSRQERNVAWAAHRRQLDAVSADLFEAALRRDDLVSAGRLTHVGELAGYNLRRQRQAGRKIELQRAGELIDKAKATHEALRGELSAHLGNLGLDPSMTVPRLETWLQRRQAALEGFAALSTAQSELATALTDEQSARTRLFAALGVAAQADGEAALDVLLAHALEIVDRQAALTAARQTLEAGSRALEIRARSRAAAKAEAETWDVRWRQICDICWLGETGTPSLAAVREILSVLQELGAALEKRLSLSDRVEKMQADRSAYAAAVSTLAVRLHIDDDAGDISLLASRIHDRIDKAISQRNKKLDAERRLEEAIEGQREIERLLDLHTARKREMTAFFDVETLDEVDSRIRDFDRHREMQRRIAALELEIREALRVEDIDAANAVLGAIDREQVERELAELEPRLADLDRRSQELYAEKSRSADRLEAVGGDDRVARLEEKRRTTLLEIEDGASRYLKLRLGAAAAEQALRIYRERHRSAMMMRASDAFRIISREAYSGLTTQAEKDRETLIALSRGGSKHAEQLSKGTRFQLYLALRVAGYHEFAGASGPVPFIADDIMETFDDFRAEEAFRLFADMAHTGQVIYLTHHRHLCDIASKAAPHATIHQLG